ncbi:hypothetical protein BGZ94_007426 [Podila epigama]|nr:hypothetical protein BGZ94_007426 [Podila epigama]
MPSSTHPSALDTTQDPNSIHVLDSFDTTINTSVCSDIRLKGQIVHLRKCYRRLFFMDLRIDKDTKFTILFRSDDVRTDIPTLTDLELTKLWKRSKRGDIIELSCFPASEEERNKRDHCVFQAVDFEVENAWPGFDPFPSEPAMGMKETAQSSPITEASNDASASSANTNDDTVAEPPSMDRPLSETWRDYCKFWINSYKCVKDDCSLKHPTGEEYNRIQELWVKERTLNRKQRAQIHDDPHATSSKVPHSQRALIFCRWLVETYGRDFLNSGSGVLDIAGGKGEISLFLTHMFGIRSTVVEPNVRRDKPYQRKNLMDVIQKQLDIEAGGDGHFYRKHIHNPSFTHSKEAASYVQSQDDPICNDGANTTTNSKTTECPDDNDTKKKERRRLKKQQLEQFVVPRLSTLMNDQFESQFPGVLESTSILIGMHPDQATEPTVDMALKYGKPFAVVPCCVFAHENPERRLKDGGDVNTTLDFIQYLMEKDSPVPMSKSFLPFDGMNIVVHSPHLKTQ